MQYETAGDPVSGLKWTHRTTGKIAEELKTFGIEVGPKTVGKLLKSLGYSLRVNHKKIALSGKGSAKKRKDRDRQFKYICRQRNKFRNKGLPIISVDTKSKEDVGNFKNNGSRWNNKTTNVYDHDFPSWATGKAIPYGIYETTANCGTVYVGTSHDTATFAAESIARWWRTKGSLRYPNARKLLVLADNGGSNPSTSNVFKCRLQSCLCVNYGLEVTVCHYPPGASKWNPIEHRLFAEISKNWAGVPLESYETILKYIRTTKTKSGLKVNAQIVKKYYPMKVKATSEEIENLKGKGKGPIKKWSYTITSK